MTDLGYSKMHALYEAMSVCGATVEQLKNRERETIASELYYDLSKVAHHLREAMTALSGVDRWPEDIPENAIRDMGRCMTMLGRMLAVLINLCEREILPTVPPKSGEQLRFGLEQIEQAAVRLADVVEAWAIPFDAELRDRIEAAFQQLEPTKAVIRDWREALESLSD